MSTPPDGVTPYRQTGTADRGGRIRQAGRDYIDKQFILSGESIVDGPGYDITAPLDLLDHAIRGRDESIDQLHAAATAANGQVHVVAGMGGGGKTTVALEIARRAGPAMPVWWVSAATPDTLSNGLRQVALALGAVPTRVSIAWEAADTAVDLFATTLLAAPGPFLLIVDNADDPALLGRHGSQPGTGTGWLRSGSRGTVLITTRDTRPTTWGAWTVHPLRPLPDDDGARVLADLAPPAAGTESDARRLAHRLGGLPLALYLAGTYLRSTANAAPWPGIIRRYEDYLTALDTHPGAALDRKPLGSLPAAREPRQIMTATWELSLSLLTEQGMPLARPLLRLLACYADAPLPYFALLDPAILGASPLFPGCNQHHLAEAIHGLAGFGLIDLHEPDDPQHAHPVDWSVTLHPLVRDTNRAHPDVAANPEGFPTLAVRLVYALAGAEQTGPPEDPAAWPWWQALTPHATYLLEQHATHPDVQITTSACRAAHLTGRALLAQGNYPRAATTLQAVLDICRRILDEDHPDTLASRHNLARVWHDQGDHQRAAAEYQAVLDASRRIHGEEHPDTLGSRHNLARVWHDQGDHQRAAAEYQAVLDASRVILAEDHPDTLASRHNLARAWHAQGDHRRAAAEYQAVLGIQRRVLGEDDPDTLITRHNLAWLWCVQGDHRRAAAELQAVLGIQRRILGEDHPHTLTTRNSLARVWHDQGDHRRAAAEYQAVLDLRRRVLGEDHPSTLATRRSLDRIRESGSAG
ncbi:tetratricopeptide repeat protein [Dactylosporangium sp. NPDC051541]|uniref:tetratricopeptide repeat protein n=1 Tax=Dactylosporangium sp. NPDC051541 TaxID=3363977 RepID=UPI0037AB38E0